MAGLKACFADSAALMWMKLPAIVVGYFCATASDADMWMKLPAIWDFGCIVAARAADIGLKAPAIVVGYFWATVRAAPMWMKDDAMVVVTAGGLNSTAARGECLIGKLLPVRAI